MNAHGPREAKADSYWIDDLWRWEGPQPLLPASWIRVRHRQPDFLARGIVRGRNTAAIVNPLVGGAEESGLTLTVTNECLDQVNAGLSYLVWIERGAGNPGSIERGKDWGVELGIVLLFNSENLFKPGGGITEGDSMQSCIQFLIHVISLAVGLGVEARTQLLPGDCKAHFRNER